MRLLPPATRFILLSTRHNENIGAAARAIKTMGFMNLALVSPHDPKVLQRSKTIQRASGATDILKNAKIYATLDDALTIFDGKNEIICGTGMPIDMYHERLARTYSEPRKFFEQLLFHENTKSENNHEGVRANDKIRIAFIFGNENSGMQESDMDKCQCMLGIPTNPQFGSLNLASAVQLIAYDWRMALGHDYDDIDTDR
jgi:tRNA/rRNA methyltransferase